MELLKKLCRQILEQVPKNTDVDVVSYIALKPKAKLNVEMGIYLNLNKMQSYISVVRSTQTIKQGFYIFSLKLLFRKPNTTLHQVYSETTI